jgi:5-methylcytosine-specific restriction endonuclease McrA
MNTHPSYAHLSGATLRAELTRAITTERGATVTTIALLAEAERQQLYLEDGYPSLYVYCTDFHHLSESDAYHRIQAAKAAVKWPQVLTALLSGDLTLSSLLILKPHLTDENCDALLAEARHQPKRAVERIVARLAPRPDPPTRIKPIAPGKYVLQITIDEETHALLLAAQNLLVPSIPDGNLAAVAKRALQDLVDRLLRRKAALVNHPRQGKGVRDGARTIPAEVRREVWQRDGGRCAFEGPRGRCPVSGAVDFHHVIPYAMGGQPTADNIELRCRAHNLHQAEKDGLGWRKKKKGDAA